MSYNKISIITATYNSAVHLPVLVQSLQEQTDKGFEWIVADGGSTDGTIEYLESIGELDIKIIKGPDFGIYDALNKAIRLSGCDYYIVIGSDDFFYHDAIQNFKSVLIDYPDADMVTCPVNLSGENRYPKRKRPWFYGQFSYVSAHSVGLLIKKELHDKYGFYSRKYPIAADQYFILNAIKNGAILREGLSAVGVHGDGGVSNIDHKGVITEFYRVQVAVGFNDFVQTFLLLGRLLNNLRKTNL